VFDLLQYLKILLEMNLLQELLGKGLFRETCVLETFEGSETASKQKRFCYSPEPWHATVVYTGNIQLLRSCTALRNLVSVLDRYFWVQLAR